VDVDAQGPCAATTLAGVGAPAFVGGRDHVEDARVVVHEALQGQRSQHLPARVVVAEPDSIFHFAHKGVYVCLAVV